MEGKGQKRIKEPQLIRESTDHIYKHVEFGTGISQARSVTKRRSYDFGNLLSSVCFQQIDGWKWSCHFHRRNNMGETLHIIDVKASKLDALADKAFRAYTSGQSTKL